MANVRIDIKDYGRVSKSIRNDFSRLESRAKKRWVKPAIALGKKLIDDNIEKGISPVKGGGSQTGRKARFVDYSKSYKDAIRKKRYSQFSKRLRPVNLKLSGKMRKSLKGRPNRDGITLFYSDKKAEYHTNEGVGPRKVIRRMLPGRGTTEVLSRTITRPLGELFVKILGQL